MDKLKSFLTSEKISNPDFLDGGVYWHQDNSSYHKARSEHYSIVASKAKKNGDSGYAELNTKLSDAHGQLADFHREAATKKR